MSARVYVGLGSNAVHAGCQPLATLQSSLSALDQHEQIDLLSSSSFYASSPVGPQDQPDYVNAVACIETSLSPEHLLDALQAIEAGSGRDRSAERRWGERSLDLDILLYANQVIETPRLTVPHCQLTQRAFVLYPLAEIAADLLLPKHGALGDVIAEFAASHQALAQELHKLVAGPV